MKASLRALLSNVIDYAGLFPPAKLPLDQAIRNYSRYRTEPEGWMLGRFICPAARLSELVPFVDGLFQSGPPLAVSALGRGGDTAADFLTGVRADLEDMVAVRERLGSRVDVGGYEVRLPRAEVGLRIPFTKDHYLSKAGKLVESSSLFRYINSLTIYCEAELGADWRGTASAVLAVLGEYNEAVFDFWQGEPVGVPLLGFKLRCGGLDAAAFPSVEQLAFLLHSLLETNLRFKATAGLHHPFRRYDPTVQTRMHGFLNLLVGGALSFNTRVGQIDDDDPPAMTEGELCALLSDEDAGNCVFTDDGIRCHNRASPINFVETAEVTSFRQRGLTSFGSCSFDEPRDDLRALGLL